MHRVSGAWKFAFLSDAIHMAREHRQNATQYLYLHLLTTKFVVILLILTQKWHISQISNEQKVRHLEQPSRRKTNWTNPPCDPVQIIRTKDWHFLKFDYRKYSNFLSSLQCCMPFTFEMDTGKDVLAIDIYNFIRA